MTTALTLTTTFDEPRMLDTDIAEALGMVATRNIRTQIIATNREELESLGTLRTATVQTGGRPATAYYLNEEQALLVCMFSRTPNAQAVRKQVIEAFMAVRRASRKPTSPASTRWKPS